MKKNLRGKYKLKPNERKDDFTQDRVVKFLNTIPEAKKLCKDEGSKRLYDYLQTMIEIDFYYPARASELRKLKISQFEIRDDIGVLKFGKMKNGNEREIYIEQPELIEKLQSLKESASSEWFFENPYKPGAVMTKEQFSYRFNRVRKLAKLSKNVVFHQLRIRATTDAFRAGIDIGTIQDLGGWKTLQMPLRYYKRAQEDYINASKKIGKFKTLYN